ncbi:HEAT repeat domain-containing protein [Catenulispora pinisilvae]|uniref:HEAT repeat domain-containing protein n=1 Tax=Catenulispora pinisilvae TaxID=2705253 RepID=UPI00189167E7|nr:HEAT repeat domain-containing protein [Catenulispora pinisilvae]
MAWFVHLTPEKNAARVRRSGLSPVSRSRGDDPRPGLYCTPLLGDYTLTYQWSREIKRWKSPRLVAVHFRIPDDTAVTVGYYGNVPQEVTAAQAVARFLSLSPEEMRGYEVFLRRGVAAQEIRRIRSLNRPVGWRYEPTAHGRRPCPCPACMARGEYRISRIRDKSEYFDRSHIRPRQEVMEKLRTAQEGAAIVELLDELHGRRQSDVFRVAHLADHPDPAVREALAYALYGFNRKAAAELLERLRSDPVKDVREAAGADEDNAAQT